VSEAKDSMWGRRAIVDDSEGHRVKLVESKVLVTHDTVYTQFSEDLFNTSAQQQSWKFLMKLFASIVIWLVALFYAYGAAVHILNMLSLTGFDWLAAPLKWQILDVVYLILDATVVAGLFLNWKIGYAAFYLAAVSQILLYTIFRNWIIDVPSEFAVTEDQRSYLTMLVIFHCVTLALMTAALKLRSSINIKSS
jgi:hypothetical protein